MTFSLSWLAVHGKEAAAVYRGLGVRATGQRQASPGSPLVGAELLAGWVLALANRMDFADGAPLKELSAGGELVTCCADENLMYSSASGWRDGRRLWYVVHEGEFGIQHIHIEGDPPPEFYPIFNRLAVDQAEAGGLNITVDHVFEVPLELAKALTGFRHDAQPEEPGKTPFEKLEPEPRP